MWVRAHWLFFYWSIYFYKGTCILTTNNLLAAYTLAHSYSLVKHMWLIWQTIRSNNLNFIHIIIIIFSVLSGNSDLWWCTLLTSIIGGWTGFERHSSEWSRFIDSTSSDSDRDSSLISMTSTRPSTDKSMRQTNPSKTNPWHFFIIYSFTLIIFAFVCVLVSVIPVSFVNQFFMLRNELKTSITICDIMNNLKLRCEIIQ